MSSKRLDAPFLVVVLEFEMVKPIEKGNFVHNEQHPEHGLGRVLAVETFSTRVMFSHGGLRVFRSADTDRLRTVASPPVAEISALEQKEATFTRSPAVEEAKPAKRPPKAKNAIA